MDFDDLDDAVGGRTYHLIVYGATGYSGCLICEHLDAVLSGDDAPQYRWAVAGRNRQKLEKLAANCKTSPGVVEVVDSDGMELMAEMCSVVVNAAGPYILCGTEVVAACVLKKTHYIDITGELVWMNRMIKKYHTPAKESGLMIIQCAGNMCTPEDIGLYLLAKRLGPLARFQLYQMEIGVNGTGGSFLSGYCGYEHMGCDELAILKDPFSLGGARKCGQREQDADAEKETEDDLFPGLWLAPGHSTACAVRVLRRSCELFETDVAAELPAPSYGESICITSRYVFAREGLARQRARTNQEPKDAKDLIKHAATMKKALERGQTIPPGAGPNRAARAEGCLDFYAVAEGENGDWAHVHITGPDPLDVTAMCAVTGALVLLDEGHELRQESRGGVLTPAYAFHGSTYADRLAALPFAGIAGRSMEFRILDGRPDLDVLQKAAAASDAKQDDIFKRATTGGIAGAVDVPDLLK